MRLHSRLAPVLFAGLFMACASINVSSNYDPSAVQEIDAYKSYAWAAQPEGGDKRVYNPIMGNQVMQAADAVLQARGYKKVDASENPDFLVGWHGSVQDKMEAETVNNYYGYPYSPMWDPYWGGPVVAAAPETYVREYEEGTILLDVVDGKSKQLVWRGKAQSEVNGNASAEKQQKKVTQAVDKILERFPPKAGKK
ncbi:putative lipoprotein [Myxococcus stipitatus DSM 14675]|uniref:Putative lipoprotein n=1 Tax=Myxococcus stipitatus (strain DSM 14675 / JCM 12634 / Mx s8) TaxID=1278073 RepID=L7UCA7_MYXSD|nr:DUF4136 domain-containing protein [Myxococcus stipitatus]AGC44099.1 putative lipoprotein [Myxococcus stipitatus DSM 14675]